MDTSDPDIVFDGQGRCNHCRIFYESLLPKWLPDERGAIVWKQHLGRIREDGRGRDYDCIIGISGGIDSSYLALRLREQGLRMLAVHIDGGWNSEVAVGNIERLVQTLGIDLYTHVIDWDEMRDLQLAFLRSGVPNQDIPQDHAFFAQLYSLASRHRIRWFLSGHNLATESVLPRAWGYNAMDGDHLRAIHRRFGRTPLHRFPVIGFWNLYFWTPRVLGLRSLHPLNWMPYDKTEARRELFSKVGWRDYGDKHHESRFTRFFQGWYLPYRYGWDKRRAHLSSLILSGQLSRDLALARLADPPYDPAVMESDRSFIAKKLGLNEDQFSELCAVEPRRHEDYPNQQAKLESVLAWRDRILRLLGKR
jgi:N-acetyl sugar amidotransferase